MAIRHPQLINQLARLELQHKIRPYLSVMAGSGQWVCHLRQDGASGEIISIGKGGDQEGAVRNAISKFDQGKVAKSKTQLKDENESLREQVETLKSKVDTEPPASKATDPADDSPAPRRRRKKREAASDTDVTQPDF